MRVLLTTEGNYPYLLGGVTTWCDRLIRGLDDHRFVVIPIVGPRKPRVVLPLPANVEALLPTAILRPREGVLRARDAQRRDFDTAFDALLGFLDDDLDAFADGLLQLARLGDTVDLWPLFERRGIWERIRHRLADNLSYEPALAEVALSIGWLRSAVSPLLFVPPKTDLVHAVGGGLGSLPAWLAARVHDRPLLITEHTIYLRERLLSFRQENDSAGLKALRAALYKNLARLTYQDADGIFAVSEFNRSWQRRLGAPAKRTRIIPPGVDSRMLPAAPEELHPVPTAVWVGNVEPSKDLDTLISAFGIVKRRVPQARLRLFGPIPASAQAYSGSIAEQIRRHGLERDVRFEGPVHPVYNAYHAGDVVVLSSIAEGLPLTAIEAMMCGKPVVATRVGAVGEVVGTCGRLVPSRDPDSLAWALGELLLNRTLAMALGRRARQRALELFSLERTLAGYRESYSLLARSRRAAPTLPTFTVPSLALPGVGAPLSSPERAARPNADASRPGEPSPAPEAPPPPGAREAHYPTVSDDPSLLLIGDEGDATVHWPSDDAADSTSSPPPEPGSITPTEEFHVDIPSIPVPPAHAGETAGPNVAPQATFDEDHLVIESGGDVSVWDDPAPSAGTGRDPRDTAVDADLFVDEPVEALDLSDSEWAYVAPLFSGAGYEVDVRSILNGVRYKLNTGLPWTRLPHRYPSADVLQAFYNRWRRDGTLDRVAEALMTFSLAESDRAPDRPGAEPQASRLPKLFKTLFGSSGENESSPDKQRWKA